MDIFLIIIAIIIAIIGILGAFIPGVPGPPLSIGALFIAKVSHLTHIQNSVIWIMFGISIIITIFDFIAPGILTRKFGGSKMAANFSILGLIVGMFFFPPFGMIIGPFIGAFIGEFITNRNTTHSFKIACISFVSFLINTGIKLIYSCIVIGIIIKGLIS